MKIVVLAGGTSTERDVSIVSGTGICGALRQKGHQAILVDVFCGQEEVDWEDPFRLLSRHAAVVPVSVSILLITRKTTRKHWMVHSLMKTK